MSVYITELLAECSRLPESLPRYSYVLVSLITTCPSSFDAISRGCAHCDSAQFVAHLPIACLIACLFKSAGPLDPPDLPQPSWS